LRFLDVDDEARALLLNLEPLTALAQSQDPLQQRMMELTPNDSLELQPAWQTASEAVAQVKPAKRSQRIPSQFRC
jgi:hypothetical protein